MASPKKSLLVSPFQKKSVYLKHGSKLAMCRHCNSIDVYPLCWCYNNKVSSNKGNSSVANQLCPLFSSHSTLGVSCMIPCPLIN